MLVLTGQPTDTTYRLIRRHLPPEARKDVMMTGFVSRSRLVGLYSKAVALIFPSHYEGCPLAVLEALSTGCPVIGYAIPSMIEISGGADGNGCILVPPFVVGGLADAILDLLDSPDREAVLRDQAGRLARVGFDLNRVAAEYRKLYAAALDATVVP